MILFTVIPFLILVITLGIMFFIEKYKINVSEKVTYGAILIDIFLILAAISFAFNGFVNSLAIILWFISLISTGVILFQIYKGKHDKQRLNNCKKECK